MHYLNYIFYSGLKKFVSIAELLTSNSLDLEYEKILRNNQQQSQLKVSDVNGKKYFNNLALLGFHFNFFSDSKHTSEF